MLHPVEEEDEEEEEEDPMELEPDELEEEEPELDEEEDEDDEPEEETEEEELPEAVSSGTSVVSSVYSSQVYVVMISGTCQVITALPLPIEPDLCRSTA